MPKAIKKRPPKKKPVPEKEVKSAALHALEALRKRQRQAIIAASAVVAVIILYVIYALYSSSAADKAYSFETEAYKYYYVTGTDEVLTGKDRWKKALELFQKSVDIKPTPTALFYLGNCYFNLGDFDNAIRQYNAFIDKFSSNKEILP
ncbi:MAG: tetratricopeptide repeat protein, partial [Deferribacteres bacterium]|nr:tetratricopeptide repeat protein [Deferribacteres bacterium]